MFRGRRHATRSAAQVAYARHFFHLHPDPRLRNPDYLARIFLGPLTLVRPRSVLAWLYRELTPGFMEYHLARTRHVDAVLEESISCDIKQLVILGAGYDSRPYRFRDQLRGVAIFELDLKATQTRKKERLRQHFGEVPKYVNFVSADFEREAVLDRLVESGYDPTRRTLFIWEGVSMFLEKQAVDTTVRLVGEHSGAGSVIVFDYLLQAMIDGDDSFFGAKELIRSCERQGEPLVFGLTGAAEAAAFLAARGLVVVADLGPEDLVERYLPSPQYRVFGGARIVHGAVADLWL